MRTFLLHLTIKLLCVTANGVTVGTMSWFRLIVFFMVTGMMLCRGAKDCFVLPCQLELEGAQGAGRRQNQDSQYIMDM